MLCGEHLWPLMTGAHSTLSPPGGRGLLSPATGYFVSRGASLTVVIHQPEAVMDPVVRLFSPRFLQGQDGEDAPRDSPTQPSSLHPPTSPPFHPFTPPPFSTSPPYIRISVHLPLWEGIPEALLPPPPPCSVPAEPTSLSLGPFPRSR